MNKLKTYVINLSHAQVRRKYMEDILTPLDMLEAEFIEGVDGRKLSESDRQHWFDYDKCVQLIGRKPNHGEVGCTLSHRLCYEALLASQNDYALILEDDVTFMRSLEELMTMDINNVLITDTPRIVLLSGDYWFWTRKNFASVYNCNGAYAYIINRAAASLLLSHRACCVSDHWSFYKNYGLEIKAVYPYMADANLRMDILSSDVRQETWSVNRKKMSTRAVISSYGNAIVRRVLKLIGHFESKIPVIDNKPVIN